MKRDVRGHDTESEIRSTREDKGLNGDKKLKLASIGEILEAKHVFSRRKNSLAILTKTMHSRRVMKKMDK